MCVSWLRVSEHLFAQLPWVCLSALITRSMHVAHFTRNRFCFLSRPLSIIRFLFVCFFFRLTLFQYSDQQPFLCICVCRFERSLKDLKISSVYLVYLYICWKPVPPEINHRWRFMHIYMVLRLLVHIYSINYKKL